MSEEVVKYPGYKRWFFTFLVIAVSVHVGVWFIFSVDLETQVVVEKSGVFVVIQEKSDFPDGIELQERATLFDSEPMFLPTKWNFSGPMNTDSSQWEPEVSLLDTYKPELRLDESIVLSSRAYQRVLSEPVDVLNNLSQDFISEFGSVPGVLVELSSRDVSVDVYGLDGSLVVRDSIEASGVEGLDDWSPMEFMVFHSDYGIGGEPLLLTSSGNEIVDRFARNIIQLKVREMLQGDRGYFRIILGP